MTTVGEQHAFLAPSSANEWGPGGCPAHPRISAAYPEPDDRIEAREGTAAHHYIATVLRGQPIKVGDLAPNGHPITQEMVECARLMIEDCRKLLSETGGKLLWCVEQRLTMPIIHPTQNWGTSDYGACDKVLRKLYVKDFKMGHRYIDAWDNYQLVDYGVGLFKFFGVPETEWHLYTVEMSIYQPRCYHPDGPRKIWKLSGASFLERADALAGAARKAMDPDAPMVTGEHCYYCSGRHECPAAIAAGAIAIDVSRRGVPQALTPTRAGLWRSHIKSAIDRLEALASGLDAQIMAYVKGGKVVPGWDLKPGEGREFWTKPMEEVYALGDLYGQDIRKPQALTPKQARDLGIDAEVISLYSDRRSGELKVKPTNDTAAAKAFTTEG